MLFNISYNDNKFQKNAKIVINLAKQNKTVVFVPSALRRYFDFVKTLIFLEGYYPQIYAKGHATMHLDACNFALALAGAQLYASKLNT